MRPHMRALKDILGIYCTDVNEDVMMIVSESGDDSLTGGTCPHSHSVILSITI